MKIILITGAFGFLGSALTTTLSQVSGYKVLGLVKSSSASWRLSKTTLNKIEILYSDRISIENIFCNYKIEGILHTATDYGHNSEPSQMIQNNVVLPIKLLEVGLNHDLGFFINTDTYFNKTSNYQYLGNYILSKRNVNDWLLKFKGIPIFNLKLEHLYGPYDTDKKFVTKILKQLYEGVKNINLTKGLQKRDFIYIDDVVALFIELIDKHHKIEQKFYDIEVGTGKSVTVKEFVLLIKNELNNSNTKLNFGKILLRENEIMQSEADLSKLPPFLCWKANIDIIEGVKKLVGNYD